jgi:predicted DCC family thiol-disulfide oxidoreductase YuxK
MVGQTMQVPEDGTSGAHLVLYDGACGLCNRLLQFLLAHDHRAVFSFASLQSSIGQTMVERFGGDPHDLNSFYLFANYKTPRIKPFMKSRAAIFVAGELGWPWKALRAAGFLPTAALDVIYDVVARNRYRVFGRSETCLVPAPQVRNRFVE